MMMNPHAASIVGIGVRQTGLFVMALTGAVRPGCGAAGTDLLRLTVQRRDADDQAKSLCGGLGSVPGAVIGAMVLGFNGR